MTKRVLNTVAVVFLLGFLACEDPVIEPKGAYETGVFISNEGPFQNGSGTISHYDRDSNKVANEIFQSVNARPLGNIVQSIAVYADKAYIVVNNAGKIEIANGDTFEEDNVITGFTMPRYFHGLNPGKAYVSQWGENGVNGQIFVLDLATHTITDSIDVGNGAGRMIQLSNFVYVANSGGFGTDSTVSVINITNDFVEETIMVGDNPNSLQVDVEGNIWVLCGGVNDWFTPSNSTAGKLVKIDPSTNAVLLELEFPSIDFHPSNLVINESGTRLFYLYQGKIYNQRTDIQTLSLELTADGSFYGLGYDLVDRLIYASDAGDFQSEGTVHRFQEDGTDVGSFSVGIIPGNFEFK